MKSEVADLSQQVDLDSMCFEVVERQTIKGILSCASSPSRSYLLITTTTGFVIADLTQHTYRSFEGERSPFYRQGNRQFGVQLGAILQARTEVGLVPNFSSRKYSSTTVYIYEYGMGIMLASFDFNLPIFNFSLTTSQLVVSNNKRIVVYDYLKHRPIHTEQYYLDTYQSSSQVDFLKYIQMHCHRYNPSQPGACLCGHYSHSTKTDSLVLFYCRVGYSQNQTTRMIYQYQQRLDKTTLFQEQSGPLDPYFSFQVTPDAQQLLIVQAEGRELHLYDLKQNCLYAVLYLGRSAKPILNLCVISIPKSPQQWVAASREGDNGIATWHFFKVAQSSPTQLVRRRYKRSMYLYKKTMIDYQVFAREGQVLGPEWYQNESKFMAVNLLGDYCEVIDFSRAGLHDEGVVKDFKRLQDVSINS